MKKLHHIGKISGVVLDHGDPIVPDIQLAIADRGFVTDFIFPLTFVFNKFYIPLGKGKGAVKQSVDCI